MLYFDHNATTFVAPEVADTMARALREVYGNASSAHRAGQLAREHLEKSRATIAQFLHARSTEIVFTSGGTESNNLAILGMVRNARGERKHLVTTAIEHPSVLEPCRQLEREGVAVTYVPVGPSGIVDADAIDRSLRAETVLVSVMHANNELGTIQPIEQIAQRVRARRAAGQQIFFHSDGVQAAGKIDVNVERLGVDLYSMSAHKMFAAKGTGALYVRGKTPLRGVGFGGRQERTRRAGTENVPGAMAFARAVELCAASDAADTSKLRDFFEREVLDRVPDAEINGAAGQRLANTSNLLFCGISGEALVIALDLKGIAVSTGSACSSGAVEPSHVLLAIGRSHDEAQSSVRFSFGRYNTQEEVNALADAVVGCARKLRASARWENTVVA